MIPRTLEWIGFDDAGEPIARVVCIQEPLSTGWRPFRGVARDEEARVIELRPDEPPDGAWLACEGGRVVGRAAVPLGAVRTAEAALESSIPERPTWFRSFWSTIWRRTWHSGAVCAGTLFCMSPNSGVIA